METFSEMLERKICDMMDYAYKALAQFPKSEKFALAADIKRCMDQIMERSVEGLKKYYKKTTLQQLDVELEKLRLYIRLSHSLGFLPDSKYDKWSAMVDELGSIIGSWMKNRADAQNRG